MTFCRPRCGSGGAKAPEPECFMAMLGTGYGGSPSRRRFHEQRARPYLRSAGLLPLLRKGCVSVDGNDAPRKISHCVRDDRFIIVLSFRAHARNFSQALRLK